MSKCQSTSLMNFDLLLNSVFIYSIFQNIYIVITNKRACKYTTFSFVLCNLIVTTYGKKKLVSNKLLRFKEIEDVHELYGEYDIIIKVSALDMKRLEDFIQKKIRSIKEIEGTQTLVVSDIPSK